jgi:capsular exopolysaccharide synthesis family protein
MCPSAEALRGLRSFLSLRAIAEKRNSIAIVSPRASEPASQLAANLAIVFAQLGERTLLLDANLRAPRQGELFGRSPLQTSGLSAVLCGRQAVKDAIIPVAPFANLHLLSSGPLPPNPQELLGRLDFAYIMETIPTLFDVVIVDAPPVLEFPDAMMIAARSSHCLMVTRRNHSRVADVVNARSQLEACGVSMLGAVLTT